MEKYQGDDIAFSVEMFTDDSEANPINLDEKDEIIVYAYTDGCAKAQLSKTAKPGYRLLVRSSSTEYAGVIDSGATKIMAPGVIQIELMITTGGLNDVKVFNSGITLVKSLIKAEN